MLVTKEFLLDPITRDFLIKVIQASNRQLTMKAIGNL